MKKTFVYILGLIFIISACDTLPDPEMETAKTFPVSGEWYVHEYYGDGSDYGPYHLEIFNTAFSKDSVWISNIYDYPPSSGGPVAIKSRVSDKTFDVTEAVDHSGLFGKVTLSNTKIINTDSIYFDVVLYDANGDIDDEFYIAGRRYSSLNE